LIPQTAMEREAWRDAETPNEGGNSPYVYQEIEPFGQVIRMPYGRAPMFRGYRRHPAGGSFAQGWPIPLDVVDEDGRFVVHAPVPGLDPKDLEVTIDNRVLTIKGSSGHEHEHKDGEYMVRERRFRGFRRSLRLPESVDVDNAALRCCNGVLTVDFPKLKGKAVTRLEVTIEEPAGESPERATWPRSRVARASGERP